MLRQGTLLISHSRLGRIGIRRARPTLAPSAVEDQQCKLSRFLLIPQLYLYDGVQTRSEVKAYVSYFRCYSDLQKRSNV